MVRKYKARMGAMTIVLTLVLNVFIISLYYFIIFRKDYVEVPSTATKYFLLVLFAIIAIVPYILHPREYLIKDNFILIKSPVFTIKKINIYDLVDIKETNTGAFNMHMRMFASKGFWGYFGIFNSKPYGRYSVYASNLTDLVFIITKTKDITIISPNQRLDFITICQSIRSQQLEKIN
ncbi:PH domain-containing protein [Chryseobacterium daecheongense]|nr:PH domain-containing protein [Chryseobacterium daecheongense]